MERCPRPRKFWDVLQISVAHRRGFKWVDLRVADLLNKIHCDIALFVGLAKPNEDRVCHAIDLVHA